jgi:hypothetical protein
MQLKQLTAANVSRRIGTLATLDNLPDHVRSCRIYQQSKLIQTVLYRTTKISGEFYAYQYDFLSYGALYKTCRTGVGQLLSKLLCRLLLCRPLLCNLRKSIYRSATLLTGPRRVASSPSNMTSNGPPSLITSIDGGEDGWDDGGGGGGEDEGDGGEDRDKGGGSEDEEGNEDEGELSLDLSAAHTATAPVPHDNVGPTPLSYTA